MSRIAVRILVVAGLAFALLAVSPNRSLAQDAIVAIEMPEPGSIVGEGEVLIEGTVTDPGGVVVAVTVSLDGNPALQAAMGPLGTFSIFYNIAPGEHEVSAEAFGADGPLPGVSDTVVFSVGDATNPPATTAPAPATTAPVTTAPVTTAPVTTAPVTTAPVTTAPATTAPVTTAPVTTAPATTASPTTDGTATTADPPSPSGPVTEPSLIATRVTTDHNAVARPAGPAPSAVPSPPATCAFAGDDPSVETSAEDSLLFLASERSLNRAELTLSTPAVAGTYELLVWVFDNESRANQDQEQLVVTIGDHRFGPTPDLPGTSHGEFAELVSYPLGLMTLADDVASISVEHAAAGQPGVGPESVRLRGVYLAACDDDELPDGSEPPLVLGGPPNTSSSTAATVDPDVTEGTVADEGVTQPEASVDATATSDPAKEVAGTTAPMLVSAEEPVSDGDVEVLGTAQPEPALQTPAAEVDGLATTGSPSQRIGYLAVVMVLCGLCLAQAGRTARRR